VQKRGTLIVKAHLSFFDRAYLYSMPDGTCIQVTKYALTKAVTSTYPSIENFIANCWSSLKSDVALLHALKEKFELEKFERDDEVALRND
jgi:hypothetical protein